MVDIVLATFNGEAFLEEQLASLLRQDFADWRLLVRDDGSSDRTVAILESYAARFPGKFAIVPGGSNLGVRGNFSELLRCAEAEYVMLCDQDDVWLPEKIRLTLAGMKALEADCGKGLPVLVHADYRVVDRELRVLAESGWAYQQIDPARSACNQLLLQNVATGGTVMINRALRDLALPIPAEALMHDWWLALVASACGRIGHLSAPLALYRQHSGNEVGARRRGAAGLLRQLRDVPAVRAALARNTAQARAFLVRYRDRLGAPERSHLEAFVALPEQGGLRRRLAILHHRFFYSGAMRNIGWLIFC